MTNVAVLAGDYFGSRHGGPSRDWSDAVTEEEEQEQLRRRDGSGYRGGRPRYRGRGSRREGFNTGSGYRPPPSRKLFLMLSMYVPMSPRVSSAVSVSTSPARCQL